MHCGTEEIPVGGVVTIAGIAYTREIAGEDLFLERVNGVGDALEISEHRDITGNRCTKSTTCISIDGSRIAELFTYGPSVKMAFVTFVHAPEGILSLESRQSMASTSTGMQVIRFGRLSHFSNDLKFEDMINVPWSTSLSLFGIAGGGNGRRSCSDEASERSQRVACLDIDLIPCCRRL